MYMLPWCNIEIVGQMEPSCFYCVYDVALGESREVALVEVIA